MPGPCGIELAVVRTVAPCSAQPVSAVEVFPDRVPVQPTHRSSVYSEAGPHTCPGLHFALTAVTLTAVSEFGNQTLAPG